MHALDFNSAKRSSCRCEPDKTRTQHSIRSLPETGTRHTLPGIHNNTHGHLHANIAADSTTFSTRPPVSPSTPSRDLPVLSNAAFRALGLHPPRVPAEACAHPFEPHALSTTLRLKRQSLFPRIEDIDWRCPGTAPQTLRTRRREVLENTRSAPSCIYPDHDCRLPRLGVRQTGRVRIREVALAIPPI